MRRLEWLHSPPGKASPYFYHQNIPFHHHVYHILVPYLPYLLPSTYHQNSMEQHGTARRPRCHTPSQAQRQHGRPNHHAADPNLSRRRRAGVLNSWEVDPGTEDWTHTSRRQRKKPSDLKPPQVEWGIVGECWGMLGKQDII